MPQGLDHHVQKAVVVFPLVLQTLECRIVSVTLHIVTNHLFIIDWIYFKLHGVLGFWGFGVLGLGFRV